MTEVLKLERKLTCYKHEIDAKSDLITQLKKLVRRGEDDLRDSRNELIMAMHQVDCLKSEQKQVQDKLNLAVQSNQEYKTEISQIKMENAELQKTVCNLHLQLDDLVHSTGGLRTSTHSSVKRKLEEMDDSLNSGEQECRIHCKGWIARQQYNDKKMLELIKRRQEDEDEIKKLRDCNGQNLEMIQKLTLDYMKVQEMDKNKNKFIEELTERVRYLTEKDTLKRERWGEQLKKQEDQLKTYQNRLNSLIEMNEKLKTENEMLKGLQESGKQAVDDLNKVYVKTKEDLISQLKEKENENLQLVSKIKKLETKCRVPVKAQVANLNFEHFEKLLASEIVSEEIKIGFSSLYHYYEEALKEIDLQKQQIDAMLKESNHSNLLMYSKCQDLEQALELVKNLQDQLSKVSQFDANTAEQTQQEQREEIERLNSVCKHLEEEKARNLETIAELLSKPDADKSGAKSDGTKSVTDPEKLVSNAFLREKNAELSHVIHLLKEDLKKKIADFGAESNDLKKALEESKQTIGNLKLENNRLQLTLDKKLDCCEQLEKMVDALNADKEQLNSKNNQKKEKIKKLSELLISKNKELNSLKGNYKSLETLNEVLVNENKVLKEREDKFNIQLKENKNQLRHLEISLASFKSNEGANEMNVEDLKQVLNLEAQLRLTKKEMNQLQLQFIDKANENEKLKKRLSDLEGNVLRSKMLDQEMKMLKSNLEFIKTSFLEDRNKENRGDKRKLSEFIMESEKRFKASVSMIDTMASVQPVTSACTSVTPVEQMAEEAVCSQSSNTCQTTQANPLQSIEIQSQPKSSVTNQSVNPIMCSQPVNPLIHQSLNQPANQASNQGSNQGSNQASNQPANQSQPTLQKTLADKPEAEKAPSDSKPPAVPAAQPKMLRRLKRN